MNSFESYCTKRVSYILTSKNRADFFEKALLIYRDLIRGNDELIIIDGGSRDNTERIVKKFKDFVNVFVSEPDINSAHALNKGILLAHGKYIKHITDDDVIYPNAMEKAIKVMEKHPEIDLLICGGTRQRGAHFSVFYIPEGVNYGKSVRDVVEFGACGVGQIIRRKSMAATRLYPIDDCADFTFPIQCIASGLNVKFCRINLFNHPTYEHSNMIAKLNNYRRDSDKTILKYFPKKDYVKYKILNSWNLWPEYTDKLYNKYPFLKTMFWPARLLIKTMSMARSDKIRPSISTDLKSLVSDKKYKWDAGLS